MIRESLKHELIEAANKTGFTPAISILTAEARECIHILHQEGPPSSHTGGSRVGGNPDLPDSVQWPAGRIEGDTSALADFIMQLNCAEVPVINSLRLPATGYIWVFVEALPSQGPELPIRLIYEPDSAANLNPRIIQNRTEWMLGDALNDVSVRFELGVSLPFGRARFREAIAAKRSRGTSEWIDLEGILKRSGALGQIGGYAYGLKGDDVARIFALQRIGRSDLVEHYQWDSIAELERAIAQVPAYVRTPEDLTRWKASFESVRPEVQWVEEHLQELDAWQLLLRLDPVPQAGLNIGDDYSVWILSYCRDRYTVDVREVASTFGN